MGTTVYTIAHGEVLSEKRTGVIRDLVPDSLGSTVALLDGSQAKSDTFSYWPYGEEASRTGTTPTPFRFVGVLGYFRDSSSRSYVRARHLDTQRGRWSSQEPLRFFGDDLNFYRYVQSRPSDLVDPTGLLCVKIGSDCYGSCGGRTDCPPKPPKPKEPVLYEGCIALCNSTFGIVCGPFGDGIGDLWPYELPWPLNQLPSKPCDIGIGKACEAACERYKRPILKQCGAKCMNKCFDGNCTECCAQGCKGYGLGSYAQCEHTCTKNQGLYQ